MKTIAELQPQIIEWAKNKGLIKPENAPKQYLKFLEEVGETAKAILKEDEKEIIDGFGDIAVTVIILADQIDNDLLFSENSFLGETYFDELLEMVNTKIVDQDVLFMLNTLCQKYGYTLQQCLNAAWGEIKGRTGKTVDGVFVKD